jgi:hypothetical protein
LAINGSLCVVALDEAVLALQDAAPRQRAS